MARARVEVAGLGRLRAARACCDPADLARRPDLLDRQPELARHVRRLVGAARALPGQPGARRTTASGPPRAAPFARSAPRRRHASAPAARHAHGARRARAAAARARAASDPRARRDTAAPRSRLARQAWRRRRARAGRARARRRSRAGAPAAAATTAAASGPQTTSGRSVSAASSRATRSTVSSRPASGWGTARRSGSGAPTSARPPSAASRKAASLSATLTGRSTSGTESSAASRRTAPRVESARPRSEAPEHVGPSDSLAREQVGHQPRARQPARDIVLEVGVQAPEAGMQLGRRTDRQRRRVERVQAQALRRDREARVGVDGASLRRERQRLLVRDVQAAQGVVRVLVLRGRRLHRLAHATLEEAEPGRGRLSR